MPSAQIICRICSNSSATVSEPDTRAEHINCPRCGNYSITMTATSIMSALNLTSRQKAYASSWVSEHPGVSIGSEDADFLSKVEPPSVTERADKLLLALNKKYSRIGQKFHFTNTLTSIPLMATSWSEDFSELSYLIHHYLKQGLNFLDTVAADFIITPQGYQHIEELTKNKINSNIGFCAMWFDESVSNIWIKAIEPAITNAGYTAKRIDTHQHNNRIDDEIIAMIRRSKFIVADFTGQRGGVYFEAGFALGLGLQVVWTCEKSQLDQVHFDNRQYSFVTWEHDKLDDFKVRLQNRIEATIGQSS